MTQFESFLREHHYNQASDLWRLIDEHPWSRRMTQRDANTVAEAQRRVRFLANDLYHLREELAPRLTAAPRLLAALELGIAYAKEHEPHLYDDAGWAQYETFLDAARAAMQAAEGEEK